MNLSKSPLITNTNLEKMDYYDNQTPDYNSRIYFQNFHHQFFCHCHCHDRCHKLNHNISFARKNLLNPLELDIKQKYNYHPLKNRSTNNIFTSNNKDSLDKLRDKYSLNFRYNNNIEDNSDLNNNNIQSYERQNHSYKDIKIKNNNCNHIQNEKNDKNIIYNSYNNNAIRPLNLFEIKRKGLSRYYHIINPKKYSYGGKILQTEYKTNNHKYKEIIGTSNSKYNILKKNGLINYNDDNYDIYDNISIKNKQLKLGNNKDISNNKENNHKFINYRYKSYQNSPLFLSRNSKYEQKKFQTESSQKIIKETFNTRLVESKELKKSPTEKDLQYNLNDNIKYNDDFKNYNYNLRHTSNKKQINNENEYNNINNVNNSHKINNRNSDCNSYQKNNHLNSNNSHIQKSYSLCNLNKFNNNNLKKSIQNEYDNNFSENYNKNLKNNYTDYEEIKLKVKLALLRKKIYEHEKERIFNNNGYKNVLNKDFINNKKALEKLLDKNQKPNHLKENLNILERTKKLLEEKKLRNKKREKNNLNFQIKSSKMLQNLQKNLREKNYDYNTNIIKPKIKIWKP